MCTHKHTHLIHMHSKVCTGHLELHRWQDCVAVPLTNNDKWMQYAKSEQVPFGYKTGKEIATIMGCVCSPVSQLRRAELRLLACVKIKKCVMKEKVEKRQIIFQLFSLVLYLVRIWIWGNYAISTENTFEMWVIMIQCVWLSQSNFFQPHLTNSFIYWVVSVLLLSNPYTFSKLRNQLVSKRKRFLQSKSIIITFQLER